MIWLKETDSTNEEIKRRAIKGAPDGLWVAADKQTRGKGRRGRSWESQDTGNLYLSLLLHPEFPPERASMVTLVMALCVAKVVSDMTGLCTKIKWPNDIVIGTKKAAGILTELVFDEKGGYYLICGVGINVNQRCFPDEIAKTATSLLTECEKQQLAADDRVAVGGIDRRKLAECLAKRFEADYAAFCKVTDMSLMKESYEALLANKGNSVRVLDPKGEYEGTALGINEMGELLVRKADGSVEAVYAGEVSVRGIYGYV